MYLKKKFCGVFNDAAVLGLQFMVHAMLFPIVSVLYYFYISTSRRMRAVPKMADIAVS